MRRVIVAVLLLGACSTEDPLDWVENADPVKTVLQDISAGRFRFLSICGYACELPGVGDLNYARCYSAVASVESVRGTSDVIRSDRHLRLQSKTSEFASKYNELLARKLDSLGKRTCPPGEQWDALLHTLSAYVHGMRSERPQPWVAASDEPDARGHDFHIHFHDSTAVSPTDRIAICKIVAEHGISRHVRFTETFGDATTPNVTQRFSCKAGAVATDDSARPT